MPSTQIEYTNPAERGSENAAPVFNLKARVQASRLKARHRNLLDAMLLKNRYGSELWMSTESICVVIGSVYSRRKTAETDTRGRRLGNCERVCRRTAQRLIDELTYCKSCGKSTSEHGTEHAFSPRVEGGGVLDEVFPANSHVPYNGSKVFRHTTTYRLNPDRLVPRETFDEYAQERDRKRAQARQTHRQENQSVESHLEQPRKSPQPLPVETPKPPTHEAPVPQRPAANVRTQHRSTRDLRSHEASKLVAKMRELMSGGYAQENALIAACLNLGLNPDQARNYLKLFPQELPGPPPPRTFAGPEKCAKCGTDLVQNRGPGPRLKCPKCSP